MRVSPHTGQSGHQSLKNLQTPIHKNKFKKRLQIRILDKGVEKRVLSYTVGGDIS